MMGTANTMCIIAESMGMSLPGNSTCPADNTDRLIKFAEEAGRQVVNLWEEGINARKIITEASVKNAIVVTMAMCGSTNSLVHIPAIASEAELDLDCAKEFNQASSNVPVIMGMAPSGEHFMSDFERAGGVGTLLHELTDYIDLKAITVTGKTVKKNITGCKVEDNLIIRPVSNPLQKQGALAVLKGNIAPDGAFVKTSAVPKNLLSFRGPALVYHSSDESINALRKGKIKSGTAVVITFQGAKGGPGLTSVFPFTSELAGSKLSDSVVVITDGRFSGATEGACFGYISPEAALKGPLLAVKDGDIIEYNIKNRSINVNLSQEEICKRLDDAAMDINIRKGYLGIYQSTVQSLQKGAVLKGKF